MLKAPTAGAIDISLSFKIINRLVFKAPALLIASYAIPALIAPSPMTAITLLDLPSLSLATAIPRAAEIDVDECPAPKGSKIDSVRFVNPERPLDFLRVDISCLLLVKIL